MEQGKYNLPQLTAEEVKPSVFGLTQEEITGYRERIKQVAIDPAHPVSDPQTLLSLNDTPILWRGCKSFVCAVAKARKTTTLTLFTSILLGKDETANGFASTPGCKVLYIDTEQAQYDSQRILYRVAKLTGNEPTKITNRLQVLSLNQYSPDEIKGIMEVAIIDFKPDVLILDNWTDCVTSVMDDEECTTFSRELRQIAEVYNLAVFSVIHANESAKNDDKPNFRGWGSEEARKSDLTMFLKDMSNAPKIEERGDYSKVTFGRCRGRRPEGFNVSIDLDGLPFIYTHSYTPEPSNDKYTTIVADIPQQGIGYTELITLLSAKTEKAKSTVKGWVPGMVKDGVIIKKGDRYFKPENTQEPPELPF